MGQDPRKACKRVRLHRPRTPHNENQLLSPHTQAPLLLKSLLSSIKIHPKSPEISSLCQIQELGLAQKMAMNAPISGLSLAASPSSSSQASSTSLTLATRPLKTTFFNGGGIPLLVISMLPSAGSFLLLAISLLFQCWVLIVSWNCIKTVVE